MQSFTKLIEEVHAIGCVINNLVELENGVWRCNLRTYARKEAELPVDCFEFGDGNTPELAIMAALEKTRRRISKLSKADKARLDAWIKDRTSTPARVRVRKRPVVTPKELTQIRKRVRKIETGFNR